MLKNTRKGLANRILSMFLVLALVFTLCPSDMGFVMAEEEPSPVTVSGTVTDSNGDGIEAVNVSVLKADDTEVRTGTTDEEGDYSVSDCLEPAKVVFSKAGFVTQTVEVNTSDITPINITLLAEGARTVTFVIETDSITMLETKTNVATISDTEGVVKYTSNNPSVATVDENTGKVTPVSAGNAIITATCDATKNYDAASDTYELTVSKVDQSPLTWAKTDIPADLTWEDTFFNIVTGGTTDGVVTYSSSNEDVATVDAKGLVTFAKAGTTTITATKAGNDIYNEVTKSYDITVNKIDRDAKLTATEVVLDTTDEGNGGHLQTIFVGIENGTAYNYDIESSNQNIVSIENTETNSITVQTGEPGITTIKFKIEGDEKYNETVLELKVQVMRDSAFDGFRFMNGDINKVLKIGETYQNQVKNNASNVTYTSNNGAVATVEESTGLVTAIGWGTATITATDGNDSIHYQVIVEQGKQTVTFAESAQLQEVLMGNTYSNVAEAETSITYTSSDPSIAVPNSDGTVTLKKAGTVVITATAAADNGYEEVSASYILRITAKTQTVSFTNADVTVTYGDDENKYTQTASSTAAGETDNAVTYSVEEGPAIIDASTGVVTINGAGTIIIKATYSGNNVYKPASATYILTVNKGSQAISYDTVGCTANVGDSFTEPELKVKEAPGSSKVVYSSNDTTIAAVDSETGEVTIGTKTGVVTITAQKAENDNYEEATASYTITVSQKTQAIKFANGTQPEVTFNENSNMYSNPASSTVSDIPNNTVTYTIINGDDLVKDFNTATGEFEIVKAGTIEIQATFSGNVQYEEVSATYVLTVNKGSQAISYDSTEYTATIGDDFTKPTLNIEEAPGSSEVIYSSDNSEIAAVDSSTGEVTIGTKTGKVTITATKAENANYKEATASYTITVSQKTQAIIFDNGTQPKVTFNENNNMYSNPASSTVSNIPDNTLTYTIINGSSLVKDFNTATGEFEIVKAGTIEIQATFSGNVEYATVSATYTLTVEKAEQTISFGETTLYNILIGQSFTAPELQYSEKHGTGAVTYESSERNVADVNTTTGEITLNEQVGTAIITATIAEDDNYESATATYTIDVKQWNAEGSNYIITDGTYVYSSDIWFRDDVELIAAKGYLVRSSKKDDWSNKLTLVTGDTKEKEVSFYVKKESNGAVSKKITKIINKDATAPSAYFEYKDISVWEKILTFFGVEHNDKYEIVRSDATSGIASVKYYVDYLEDGETSIAKKDVAALDLLEDAEWTIYNKKIEIAPNQIYTIYAKVTDNAGNYVYASTNGIVHDITGPSVDFEVITDGTLYEDTKDGNKIYDKDIDVKVIVTDEAPYSGIQTVTWEITDFADNSIASDTITVTNLPDPNYNDLEARYEFTLDIANYAIVDNSFIFKVTAEDFSGNVSEEKVERYIIDTTVPTVDVSFTDKVNAYKTEDGVSYFDADKEVTIVVTERKELFDDGEEATKCIQINEEAIKDIEWNTVENDTNSDLDKHTAVITFTEDNTYDLIFAYEDLLGKAAETKELHFVIDKVAPKLTVDAKEENKVPNKSEDPNNVYDIYGGNINVELSVKDSQISSNIETLEYVVTCYNHTDKDNGSITAVKETMSDIISPQDMNECGVTFEILAKDNQADKIVLTVIATDNCGNSVTETRTYAINTKEPVVEIKYDNNNCLKTSDNKCIQDENGRGYFDDDRILEIVYTESSDLFNQAKALAGISIEARDSAGNDIAVDEIVWEHKKGATCYQDTHTATVTLSKDANYDVSVEYVNDLNNSAEIQTSSEHPYTFAIDREKPVITIEYLEDEPSVVVDEKGYYNASRTATITIDEKTSFGDLEKINKIKDSIIIITAKDCKGKNVDNAVEISDFSYEDGVYKATVIFGNDVIIAERAKNAHFTLDVQFTDKAGYTVETATTKGETPYNFVVDTVNPTGTIKIGESFWNKLLSKLDVFGWFNSNKAEKATITYDDITSGVKSVEYFRTTNTTLKTAEELKEPEILWNPYTEELDLLPDSKLMIYARIVDKSGLTTYLSTGGIVIDANAPVLETLKPEITITAENGNDTIYTDDVAVSVNVKEPVVEEVVGEKKLEIYSGIKEIKYKVTTYGQDKPTIDETLEAAADGTFVEKVSTTNENTNQFIKAATVDFVVDAARNNSNSVVVEVEATDFAGNVGKETINLKIDTTPPQISVRYDNNDGDTSFGNTTYFNKARTATITIKEDNFDPGRVSFNGAAALSWSSSASNANGDGGVHEATVSFASDGDYTFGISCTDKAGHGSGSVDYGGSLAPMGFTIDLTEPQITVSYDNNNAMNGNYYRNARVATIQINEHNFEPSRINYVVTATDNGQQAALPALSNWVSNGDTHTATVVYDKDALYTFDLDYTDKAGNKAADIPMDTFYVDLTAPKVSITNIVDESANSGDGNIGFSITATDTNFDVFTPVLTAVVKEGNSFVEKTISGGGFSNIANGQVYTIRNVDLDGIYRIACTVVDKAGNAYTDVTLQNKDGSSYVEERTSADTLVTFSVNRNGSAYEVDKDTMEIVKQYYVQDITKDVVLVEVNTNSLKEYKVTLNGKELKENSDYTVKTEGGRGEWMKYIYSVNKSLFEAEGQYKIVVSSVDEADNNAFSDVKDATVTFVVDRTAPVISVSGLESNGRYQVERQTVTIIPTDDGGALKSLLVRTVDEDGNELVRLIDLAGDALLAALEENDGKIVFEIEEGLYQNVQIICNDCAIDTEGNTNTYNETFYEVSVSTSAVKILLANKGVRYGIIGGIILILGGVALLVFRKKKVQKETK